MVKTPKKAKSKTSPIVEPSDKPIKTPKVNITNVDLLINSKEDTHYYEIKPEGDSFIVGLDVPNNVGSAVRLRKMKECQVIIKFIGDERIDYEMPPVKGIKFVDFVKYGNSWNVIERPI